MRVFLDMDEVLVDFVGGACSVWGITKAELHRYTEPGRWDMVPPLSKALGLALPMSQEEFWGRIDREEFWLGLEATPWFDDLIGLVGSLTNDWHIISAPSQCPSSYSGKVKWLKRRFGRGFDRFVLTPHKHIFAHPDAVLVDDRDKNLSDFIRHGGGAAISLPSVHNRLHALANRPYPYVKSALLSWSYKSHRYGTENTERQHGFQYLGDWDNRWYDPDLAVQ